jgi:DNA invertase Pin-like site-specific DNA recombinase
MRPPVFWSYLRWSTPPQEFGDSERRQIEPGKAWAASRDIQFVDDYRDAGVSAWSGKNLTKGALGRFMKDLGSHDPDRPQPGDYLGVESLDRLCRSKHTLDAAELVNTLFKRGITLVLHGMGDLEINREISRDQPWLVDMLIREFQRGGSESTWKSDRVRKAKATLRKRGQETGVPITGESCPGWLILVGADKRTKEIGHYELHPENSKIVQQIFEWGALGYGGAVIAGMLNRADVKPFRKIGPKMTERIANGDEPKWHPNVVRLLLSNRAVIGYTQPCKYVEGKRVPDGPEKKLYPAVIDESLFEEVQIILGTRKGHKGAGRKSDYANLFTGLCRCETCGKGVVLRHQKGKAYLICEMARHGSCTNKSYFPYPLLEQFIIEDHPHIMGMNRMLLQLTPEQEHNTSRVPELENQLADLRMNRRRLVERFGKGDDDADALIDQLDNQIRDAEKELTELRHDELVGRHSEDFYNRWKVARAKLASKDSDARAKMATLLKERITSVVLTPRRTVILSVTNGRRNSQILKLEISPTSSRFIGDKNDIFKTWVEWRSIENPHEFVGKGPL